MFVTWRLVVVLNSVCFVVLVCLVYVLRLLLVGLFWRLFVVIVYVELDSFSDDGFAFVEGLFVFI